MKSSKFIIVLLLALLTAITTIIVSGIHAEKNDPQPMEVPIMARHESAPVMTAISAMYAPAENKEHWIRLVCSGMTEGGCEFFKSNLADSIWRSQANHDASSAGYIADEVTVINDTTQLWRASLTIFEGSDEVSSDVFLLSIRGNDGFWYLDRVLFGPGISLGSL